MDLCVILTCLDSGKTDRIKINVKEWNSLCVKELKDFLEDKIRVPSSDQMLFYQGRPLNDDLFPLKKLYLRQGDDISVQCTAQGNLSGMKKILQKIKDFSDAITCQDQIELLTVSLKKDNYLPYDDIVPALENLSFSFFIPWKNAQSVVHRHYFVQEGGFDAFMEVLKFASKRYRTEDKPNSRKLSGKYKANESETLAEILKELNNEQMILQMHCLSLLWNFSETFHDRRLVLQKGGLQLVLKALMLDPNEYTHGLHNEDEYYEVAGINETAVGCLVQYAEFPDCQEVIARNPETVGKLMLMVANQFQTDGPYSYTTYNKYSAQIAANTLFCCACSVQTPKVLFESGMHKRMINLMNLWPAGDLALSYYCTLFLARTRASPLVWIDPHTANCIDKIIASFLAKNKPDDISTWEENHNYVWVSMIPFVSLAFSGQQAKETDVSSVQSDCNKHEELENSVICECFRMSESCQAIVLASQDEADGPSLLTAAEEEVIIAKNDNIIEGSHESFKTTVDIKNQIEGSGNSNSSCVDIPSAQLYSVAEDRKGVMLGSKQTQKLGLLTLLHMLNSSGNRQLVEDERLLPYLDCLCWHISPDDGRLLKAELRKYWSPKPATLAAICKTSLAFVYGFEVVLKM